MASFRASFAGGGTSSTGNRSVTITPAVNDLIVVFVSLSANTNSAPTMTDDNGSGTYALVGTALWNSSANNMAVFVRNTLMANTNSTVITCNSGSNTAGELVAIAISSMSKVGSAAVRSSGSQANQASGGTPAPVLNQTALTTNVTIAGVASGDTTTTEPSGWTERQDASQATPTTALEVATRDSGFTGTTITFGATQGTVFASFAIELDGSDEGTLASTLGALTSSATGTVEVRGTASPTLGALISSAAGTVEVQGTLAVTLSAATLAATGTVADSGVNGELAATLGALTASATGTVEVQGTASPTLGAVVSSAAGTVEVRGTANPTLGAVVSSAAGTVEVRGTASPTLGAVTTSATGTVEVQGTASLTLGALTGSATGTVEVQGTVSSVLDALSLVATGIVGSAAIHGELNATLGALTLNAHINKLEAEYDSRGQPGSAESAPFANMGGFRGWAMQIGLHADATAEAIRDRGDALSELGLGDWEPWDPWEHVDTSDLDPSWDDPWQVGYFLTGPEIEEEPTVVEEPLDPIVVAPGPLPFAAFEQEHQVDTLLEAKEEADLAAEVEEVEVDLRRR